MDTTGKPLAVTGEDLTATKSVEEEVSELTGAITYGLLSKRRNPAYREDFWARSRAFYKGGVHLLENATVMSKVFPRHVGEHDHVYTMRQKLAHYTNHSGSIVNHLLGKLMSDPARAQADEELDEFYTDFLKDCSPPDGEEVSLNDLLAKMFLDAAQVKTGYALVEMPNNSDTEAKTLAQQEALGALDVWCTDVKAESVVDWEKDKAGEYLWVLLCFKSCRRESVFADRNTIHEEYWMYNRDGWVRWDVYYKEGAEPKAEEVILPTEAGLHTFSRVPLVCLDLPDGLWIMAKLESLAREYFNKRNALSWAEFKALLPVLYEYLDPGAMPTLSGPGGDEDRATSQKRSPAHVQQRQAAPGSGDRAEWLAPPDAPFAHSLSSCEAVCRDMYKIVQQMALDAENKGAALKRSGESKKEDTKPLDVVLGAYGKIGRRVLARILQLVVAGRGDEFKQWNVSGLSKFDLTSTGTLIDEETMLDAVEMPSATFKAERKKQLARKALGDSVSEEQLNQIDEEIELYFSPEGESQDAEELRQQIREELERQKQEGEEYYTDDEDASGPPSRAPGKRMVISTFKGNK